MVHVRVSSSDRNGGVRHVFLLEAYVAAGSSDVDPVGQVRAALLEDPALRLVGTVVIPDDEAMLCLVEAPDEDAAEALLARLGTYAIRVVEVRWVPSRPG